MTIHEKLDYIMENSGGGPNSNLKHVYYLGTGTSFNIKTLLPEIDYASLTPDKFIIGLSGIPSGSTSSTEMGISRYTASASLSGASLTKSYNTSTGVLTIGGYSGTVTLNCSDSGRVRSTSVSSTPFVYLMI